MAKLIQNKKFAFLEKREVFIISSNLILSTVVMMSSLRATYKTMASRKKVKNDKILDLSTSLSHSQVFVVYMKWVFHGKSHSFSEVKQFNAIMITHSSVPLQNNLISFINIFILNTITHSKKISRYSKKYI